MPAHRTPLTRPLTPPPSAAGFVHSRPEPMYFWFYFVVVNAIWIVVPLACVAHAWRAISAAVGSGKPKAKRK